MIDSEVTRRVVGDFLRYVRSGRNPQRAAEFMAPAVRAHQVQSEDLASVERTPDGYAEHVREMTGTWGAFDLTIEEFLVDGARAYVRLAQVGRHLGRVDGIAPTGRTSARSLGRLSRRGRADHGVLDADRPSRSASPTHVDSAKEP